MNNTSSSPAGTTPNAHTSRNTQTQHSHHSVKFPQHPSTIMNTVCSNSWVVQYVCTRIHVIHWLFFFFFFFFAAVSVDNDVFLPKITVIDSCFWCCTHLVSCAGLYPVLYSFYIETAFLLLVKAELEWEKHNIFFFFFLLSPVISHLHACKRTRTLLFTQWEWTEMHETFLKSPVIPGKPGCRSLVSVCFTYRNSSMVCTEIIWIS